jgi:transposase
MTKTEQLRVTTWRSRVLQHAAAIGNVARTCRRFGISRKSFYKWRRRFVEHGDAGLCDRPRAPQYCPRATASDVISKILYLRQHYHFGAGRIADYLKRFHEVTIARSTVHRILTRRGLKRLPANQSTARMGNDGSDHERFSMVLHGHTPGEVLAAKLSGQAKLQPASTGSRS